MTIIKNSKFTENWVKNAALHGTKDWENEPDFAYFIQGEVPLEVGQKIFQASQVFFEKIQLKNSKIIAPEQYYLTITLPGRLGTHFQKNDLPFMTQTLKDIAKNTQKIELTTQSINCFPTSLFVEINDPTNRLQQLHETLCNEIPFSQHPEFRYKNYLPHITIAHGGNAHELSVKQEERHLNPTSFELENISLGKTGWKQDQLHKEIIENFQLN